MILTHLKLFLGIVIRNTSHYYNSSLKHLFIISRYEFFVDPYNDGSDKIRFSSEVCKIMAFRHTSNIFDIPIRTYNLGHFLHTRRASFVWPWKICKGRGNNQVRKHITDKSHMSEISRVISILSQEVIITTVKIFLS